MICPKCLSPEIVRNGSNRVVCRSCGKSSNAPPDDSPKIQAPPPIDDLKTLLARRKGEFARKEAHEAARRLIQVRIPTIGPYAIIHLGDPHVDDDGTNITVLEQHLLLAQKTEGLYLANVGDSSNNWIGRLARLYADQSTTAAQAWMLVEWMMKLGQGRWVYLIGGNHDAWSGSGDPIQWMAKGINALYQSSEARLELSQPGTKATIRINARHDFSGHSQWNPAHGVMKAAQMGVKDHIMICGHKHTSGYSPIKCPDDDMITHCIQVGSYKVFDRYGREKGFRDQHISPAVLTVIDTTRPANGIVTVFHDIEEGVDFLKFKRRKK